MNQARKGSPCAPFCSNTSLHFLNFILHDHSSIHSIRHSFARMACRPRDDSLHWLTTKTVAAHTQARDHTWRQ